MATVYVKRLLKHGDALAGMSAQKKAVRLLRKILKYPDINPASLVGNDDLSTLKLNGFFKPKQPA